MMMSSGCCSSRSRFPFTVRQWQELELQALVFKYMVCGMTVPPDLLCSIRRSLFGSSNLSLIQQPQSIGWMAYGSGRKMVDPEPGRCRRTDGKKWRCSKEAYPDSKYCQRHMHRGRNRSRKPVELLHSPPPPPSPNAISINTSLAAKNTIPAWPSQSHFLLHPQFSSSRPPTIALSSQENTTNNALHSAPAGEDNSRNRGYGRGLGMRLGWEDNNEHAFFSETNSNNNTGGCSVSYSSWKLALPAAATSSLSEIKHSNAAACSEQKILSLDERHHYMLPSNDDHAENVTHHFLDEWPPKDKDSEDILPTNATGLSISVSSYSLHDFFMTQKW